MDSAPSARPPLPSLAAAACAGVLVLAAATAAWAGAWVQPRDSYYFKLSASWLDTDRELDSDGNEVDILAGDETLGDASYSDLTVNAYVEYGLTDRLTLIGTLPFRVLTSDWTESIDDAGIRRDIEATNGGLGDLSVGLRYPVVGPRVPLAVQGGVKLPLGYDNAPDNGGPPLGSGQVDVEAWLLAGASLYPFPGYVTAGTGYRVKGGDVDDEFLLAAEAGVRWSRLSLRAGVDALFSTGDPPDLSADADGSVSSSVVVTEQDIVKLTPALGVALTGEISLVFEAFHIVDGKNTVTGTAWAAGVVFQQ